MGLKARKQFKFKIELISMTCRAAILRSKLKMILKKLANQSAQTYKKKTMPPGTAPFREICRQISAGTYNIGSDQSSSLMKAFVLSIQTRPGLEKTGLLRCNVYQRILARTHNLSSKWHHHHLRRNQSLPRTSNVWFGQQSRLKNKSWEWSAGC